MRACVVRIFERAIGIDTAKQAEEKQKHKQAKEAAYEVVALTDDTIRSIQKGRIGHVN